MPRSCVIHLPMQRTPSPYRREKDDLLAFINECIDEYYADGTYDTLWTKWIDASGEGEEAAAAEDAETAE